MCGGLGAVHMMRTCWQIYDASSGRSEDSKADHVTTLCLQGLHHDSTSADTCDVVWLCCWHVLQQGLIEIHAGVREKQLVLDCSHAMAQWLHFGL